MIDVDLFGHTATCPNRTKRKPVDVFKPDFDLSSGERHVIASYLHDHAASLRTIGVDKTADKIDTEADRYMKCGDEAIFLTCPACYTQYYVRIRCRSRICEHCGRVYKADLQRQIQPLIKAAQANRKKGYVLALLTLTVTSDRFGNNLPDREDIKRLYRESSTFLRLFYGKHVARLSAAGKVVENRNRYKGAGWIATLEVGKDNNNAHCHAIVYGPFYPWERLRSTWQKITGDSRGVDIRQARSPRDVAGYVLKYITKPPQTDSYKRIADYVMMIKGTRRLRTGGIWYNRVKNLTIDKPTCQCIECSHRLEYDFIGDWRECDRVDLYGELRRIQKLSA